MVERASVIHKPKSQLRLAPHLADYDAVRREFTWDAIACELGLAAGAPLNIAQLALDRHLATPVRDRVAFRFIGRDLARRDMTYGELAAASRRFASVLQDLGIGRGDAVFILAGRIPELYVAALGALRNGSVVSPSSPRSGRSRSGRASRWAKRRRSSPPKRSTRARSRASGATFPASSTCCSSATTAPRRERRARTTSRR